jgi:hypothetical protein
LFGFAPTQCVASLLPRTKAWRVGGAVGILVLFSVIASFAIFIPPHGVWTIGALTVAFILARKRWLERFTLHSVNGSCPKCKIRLSVKSGSLRCPHPIACDGCHHTGSLELPQLEVSETDSE